METNEQQIQRLVEEWHRRTAQGELDAVLGLMTEDAVFPQMYKPSHDEEEIRSRFREWAGRARIESKYEVKDIHASGDVAYLWSHISIVMTSKESGSSTKREGHVLASFASSPLESGFLPRRKLIPTGKQEQA